MCALRVLQHHTKVYYHHLPADYDFVDELRKLEKIRMQKSPEQEQASTAPLLPKRDAITEIMAQLPASDFPELVEQILIENLEHKRGDITDGPGDEGRDIHTITSSGSKHLIQCRHTQNSQRSNLDRHDLDELWAATSRLNYEEGLLVTNSDMTTPAKASYVNGDYCREGHPKLTVWNGRDLWAQIRSNQNILNRWFAGLAQLHTVRRFSFKALPVEMPGRKPFKIDELMKDFVSRAEEIGYQVEETGIVRKLEDDQKIVFIRSWFTSFANMFMPCILASEHDLATAPFTILEFHVVAKGPYPDPESLRRELVSILLQCWKENTEENWLSILTSDLMAPVYIHDTQDTILSPLKDYSSYVFIDGTCTDELDAATVPGEEFSKGDPAELLFIHEEKGIEFVVNYGQPMSPTTEDTAKIILHQADKTLRNAAVFSVKYKNRFEFSMAIASTKMTTLVLQDSSRSRLYFCFELDKDNKEILKKETAVFIRSLKSQSITWKLLNKKEIKKLRKRLPAEMELIQPKEYFSSRISEFRFPIELTTRNILCMKDIELPQPPPPSDSLAFELLKYKLLEQHKEGYDEGFREGENVMSLRQLKNLLFSPTVITGRESINIDINGYPEFLRMVIVFRPKKFESLSSALAEALVLTEKRVDEICKLINSCPPSN